MSHGRPPMGPPPENSLQPTEGWHCTHIYYSFQRAVLAGLSTEARQAGAAQLVATLDPEGPQAPERLQTSIVSGHKADFGLMLMDPDPLKVDRLHQAILAGPLGVALTPTYSFVSITEISEYVPSLEQYGERLVSEGETPGSPAYEAKMNAYEKREPIMRRQRLTPDLPALPGHLLLSDEQETEGGRELVLLAVFRAQQDDGRACS